MLEQSPDHQVSKADLQSSGGETVGKATYGAFLKLSLEGRGFRVEQGDNASPVLAWRPKMLPNSQWDSPSFEEAMIEVARRYFRTYGPAMETDLQFWLSCSARESKTVVQALVETGQLTEVRVEEDSNETSLRLIPPDGLEMLNESPPSPRQWPVRLLGRFDPLLLAHADKGCWIDREHYKRVWHHTHIEAVLLVQGRIQGVWRSKRGSRGLAVSLELFGEVELSAGVERIIEKQAAEIAAFLGLPLLGLDWVERN
jgi:hypothetical protein